MRIRKLIGKFGPSLVSDDLSGSLIEAHFSAACWLTTPVARQAAVLATEAAAQRT
jgi:hypothetical protein